MINDLDYRAVGADDIAFYLRNRYPGAPGFHIEILSKLWEQFYWYLDVTRQDTAGLESAVTDEAKNWKLHLLNYTKLGVSSTSASITLKFSSTGFTIPKEELKFFITTLTGSYTFHATQDLVVDATYKTISVFEGNFFDEEYSDVLDGTSEWQRVLVQRQKVLLDSTFKVWVGLDEYTKKSNLINSFPGDKHFLVFDKQNIPVIEFGNAVYGDIPPAESVRVQGYVSSGSAPRTKLTGTLHSESFTSTGAVTQIFQLSEDKAVKASIKIYLDGVLKPNYFILDRNPADDKCRIVYGDGNPGYALAAGSVLITYSTSSDITISYGGSDVRLTKVFLETDVVGGNDGETYTEASEMAPRALATNDRAIVESDFEVLAKRARSDVLAAKAFPFYYGENSLAVQVIPFGGGASSAYINNFLRTYYFQRKPMDNRDVDVIPAEYQEILVSAGVKMLSGYSFSLYKSLADFAVWLYLSERFLEFKIYYSTNSISTFIDIVNAQLGYSFPYSFGGFIQSIMSKRIRNNKPIWAGKIRVNEIIGILDDLDFVDYPEISLPAADITLAFNKVSTAGLISITEIV